jgi:hypothetical protein
MVLVMTQLLTIKNRISSVIIGGGGWGGGAPHSGITFGRVPPLPVRVEGSLESNYYGDRYVHLRGAAPVESPKVSILAQATLAHVIALARRLGRGSLFGEPGSVALRGSAH